ncbi:MAG: helix-turn-helix domain-containing protein [Solirubrobacteraceae bacterium]
MSNNQLGEYVRSRRTAKGFSLAQAERRSGVDLTYWSKLELGDVRAPNPRYLAAIANTLEVPVQELYGLAGYYLPEQLPSFGPYLRARYDLDAAAFAQLLAVFEQVSEQGDDDRMSA